jgi:uncharacterized protein YegL
MKTTNKTKIYPLYLVIDNSGSMDSPLDVFSSLRRIDVAKGFPKAILQLYEESQDLVVNLRLSVLTFNKKAEIVLPLSPIPELRNLNTDWNPKSRTHFAELFDTLRLQIQSDFEAYRSEFIFHNPAIVIITDGIPSDELEVRTSSYNALLATGPFNQPIQILMYGVEEAREETLLQYATSPRFALKANPLIPIADQVEDLIIALKRTVRDSLERESEDGSSPKNGWVKEATEEDDEEDDRW